MSEHAGNCGYVLHGWACDCGLWEQSAVMFKHQERIRELEASIAALKNDRLTWAMACECACDACEVLSSRIAHLPTVDREGEHG
jgi:hypothetical protein